MRKVHPAPGHGDPASDFPFAIEEIAFANCAMTDSVGYVTNWSEVDTHGRTPVGIYWGPDDQAAHVPWGYPEGDVGTEGGCVIG